MAGRYFDGGRLPIARYREKLLWALERHSTLVVMGDPGCGKSTQVPVYLYEAGWCAAPRCVVVVEPRAMAARSVSERVGAEVGREVVGYASGLEESWDPSRTRIKFVTASWMLRAALFDPLMSQYSVVMVDEVHERTVETDLLLGLLKKVQGARRREFRQASKRRRGGGGEGGDDANDDAKRSRFDDVSPLRVVLASATLDPKKLQAFFGENDTATCSIAGRATASAVDVFFSDSVGSDYVEAAVECAAAIHSRESNGDALVFLPTAADVDECIKRLQARFSASSTKGESRRGFSTGSSSSSSTSTPEVLALRAGLDDKATRRILDGPAMGRSYRRRIVVATSVAETALTIPGVKYVVDSGLSKLSVFDGASGCELAGLTVASKASARHRAGRAGRDGPGGKCYRLYTEAAFRDLFPAADPPPVARSDLAWALLRLKALGVDNVLGFDLVDPPPAKLLVAALDELRALGALDDRADLTRPKGLVLAEAPCQPRLAAFLLAAAGFGERDKDAFVSAPDYENVARALAAAAVLAAGRPLRSAGSARFFHRAKREQADLAFRDDLVHLDGDHATAVNVLAAWPKPDDWARDRGIDPNAVNAILAARRRLAAWLLAAILDGSQNNKALDACLRLPDPDPGGPGAWDATALRKALVAGFFARAARLAPDASYRAVKADRPVRLDPNSVYSNFGGAPPPFVCFCDYALDDDLNVIARHVARVDPKWLLDVGDYYSLDKDLGFTRQRRP